MRIIREVCIRRLEGVGIVCARRVSGLRNGYALVKGWICFAAGIRKRELADQPTVGQRIVVNHRIAIITQAALVAGRQRRKERTDSCIGRERRAGFVIYAKDADVSELHIMIRSNVANGIRWHRSGSKR